MKKEMIFAVLSIGIALMRGSALGERWGIHWYPTGWESVKGKEVLCTNPLSWKTDHVIMARGTTRATALELSEQNYEYKEKFVLGPMPKGKAFVKEVSFWSFRLWRFLNWSRALNNGNLHFFDFQLFFKDIRKNASERIEAFFKK